MAKLRFPPKKWGVQGNKVNERQWRELVGVLATVVSGGEYMYTQHVLCWRVEQLQAIAIFRLAVVQDAATWNLLAVQSAKVAQESARQSSCHDVM